MICKLDNPVYLHLGERGCDGCKGNATLKKMYVVL